MITRTLKNLKEENYSKQSWGNWHLNKKNNTLELFNQNQQYLCQVDLDTLKDSKLILGMIFYMQNKIDNKKDIYYLISALKDNVGIYGAYIG